MPYYHSDHFGREMQWFNDYSPTDLPPDQREAIAFLAHWFKTHLPHSPSGFYLDESNNVFALEFIGWEDFQTRPQLPPLPDQCRMLSTVQHIIILGFGFESLPFLFHDFHNLQSIDCRFTEFTGIPDWFENWPQLIRLSCTAMPLESLPPSLGKCKNLETLTLTNCRFTSLPNIFSDLVNLKMLRIENNPLQNLSPSLCHCQKLEEIYAQYCFFETLPEWISALHGLKMIDFSTHLGRVLTHFRSGGQNRENCFYLSMK